MRSCLSLAITVLLAGCAGVGPDFQRPAAQSPASWQDRSGGDPTLAAALTPTNEAPAGDWWQIFNDAALNQLEQRALTQNPDLQTAALRYAEARLGRRLAASAGGPDLNFEAGIARQRGSEHGAETRLANAFGGANRDELIKVLSAPFNLYQLGFDASWELDLWGRVRRSIEAADANSAASAAALEQTRLALASELARTYFELRQLQRRDALLARETAIVADLQALTTTQIERGLSAEDPRLVLAERAAALDAQRNSLRASLASTTNRLSLLTGDAPGTWNAALTPTSPDLDRDAPPPPVLALGLPGEVIRNRPDIRAAEARLHAATANVGVAVADLYPRLVLGAGAGLQSIDLASLTAWGARDWKIGPSLSLPLFDRGRRRTTIALRKLEQQEAAIAWRQQVLQAWHEVDDALNGYAAEQARNGALKNQLAQRQDQYALAQIRSASGLTNAQPALQAEQMTREAQRELAESDAALRVRHIAAIKAIGGAASNPQR